MSGIRIAMLKLLEDLSFLTLFDVAIVREIKSLMGDKSRLWNNL